MYLNYIDVITENCVLGSKKGNQPAAGTTGKNSGHIQVIHNGKIVTPQSLLPRKTARATYNAKKLVSDNLADGNSNEVEKDSHQAEDGPDGEREAYRSLKKHPPTASSMRKYVPIPPH